MSCLRCITQLAGDTWGDPESEFDWEPDEPLYDDEHLRIQERHKSVVDGQTPWSISVWELP